MVALKKTVIRTGLETLYFTGTHLAMEPRWGGVGVILTLHHVRPPRADRFQPNRLLEVTPAFLERVLLLLRELRLDLISLDRCTGASPKAIFAGGSPASRLTTGTETRCSGPIQSSNVTARPLRCTFRQAFRTGWASFGGSRSKPLSLETKL